MNLPLVAAVFLAPQSAAEPPARIDFGRDVRPILSDNCFQCHGPDEKTRKADLRLDTRDGLLAAKDDVIARVAAKDSGEVMPPPKAGKQLTAAQIATLKAWVEQGAAWSGHWAFTGPRRPAVPEIRNPKYDIRNPIDAFVAERLIREGLGQSPAADPVTLLRRVTLDLTGLPPTPAEVDAFVLDLSSDARRNPKDKTPNAYEKVVDRLLASPRYGERQAWRWLEAARYADTNGYQTDAGRDMWRWRDWVIDAYNRNLPFDRFTVEQLAGDMLPSPTLDQRIATGFNRNHRGNAEGGIVPEEYAAEYVADRVETTATVWLGLTFTCARCHDHKFDPLTQREFYRLFAYFNNVPEKGRAVKFGNSPPYIKAPTREQRDPLDELDVRLKEAAAHAPKFREVALEEMAKWAKTADPAKFPKWSPGDAEPAVPTKPADPDVGDFGFDDRFTLACRVNPRKPDGTLLSRTTDEARGEGYAVRLAGGKIRVELTKRWLDDALRVETVDALSLDRWSHVAVTYDASRLATGTRVYIDGAEATTRVLLDELNQTFQTKEPFRVGAGAGAKFDGRVIDVAVYAKALDAADVRLLAVPASPADIVKKADRDRTDAERDKLLAYFVEVGAGGRIAAAHREYRALRAERQKLWDAIPTVMVMEEMQTPRDTHVLVRGEYDKKGEKVTPGVPAALSPLPAGAPNNRLGFSRWLVAPDNPLTARVAVNRMWQMHFGAGLVKTVEDFGTQGAFPTHPELLDWMACEFATDWDVKRLHKLIVTSATYQQSSRVTPELLARDPENKLLARFPRLRLSAEVLRDQALFASGLLVEKVGGPSVKPYQPPGLWNELSGAGDYTPDRGENLYRRSLYTYWKRTSPPPVLAAFDAAGRETCWVRESRTNTPLQALALLNETAFVEAARVLAERVLRGAKEPDARLAAAFRRVAGRTPSEKEAAVLRRGLDFHLAEFRRDPAGAKKLLAVGESKPDATLDPAEVAAYAAVCNVILNLDEVVTRE